MSSIKAYWGEVVRAHISAQCMHADAAHTPHHAGKVLSWAHITVHNQDDVHNGHLPVFKGAFSVCGITHHIMTHESYLCNWGVLDPDSHQDSVDVPD
jgi:hypothetical protein